MLYYGNSLKTSFNSKKMGDENLGKLALVTNEHWFFKIFTLQTVQSDTYMSVYKEIISSI